jgi:hypothetical protein
MPDVAVGEGGSQYTVGVSTLATIWRGLCRCPVMLPPKEAPVARAVISDPKRHTAYEPLYEIDPQTGDSVEIFYADRAVARSFGTSEAGWFWWTCRVGSLPSDPPTGPFTSSYRAYRNFAGRSENADTVQTHPFSRFRSLKIRH